MFERAMKSLMIVVAIVFALIMQQAQSAVDGHDLLRACESAINSATGGIAEQMCEYYVTPCNCDGDETGGRPSICLPDDLTVNERARIVVDGLRRSPALLREYAGTAAAVVLEKIYPCNDD